MLKSLYIICAICITTVSIAQERDQDTLQTDVINVVKPYTPSISDAFKVKETPNLNDDTTNAKKEIDYNIFSFPVASTFTPAKGKAASVVKNKKEKTYNNYASLGFGSNISVLGELYVNHQLDRNQSIGAALTHSSSQQGVNDVLVDANFSDSKIDLNYSNRGKDLTFLLDGGFQYKTNNWYGLKQPLFNQATTDSLDVSQSYSNAYIGGDVTFNESILNGGHVLYRRFGDSYSSGENRFKISADADVDVLDQTLNAEVYFDYLSGSFERNYFIADEINYGIMKFGVAPTYVYSQDDLVVNIGFKAVYANNSEAGEGDFFIYPNVSASYNIVPEVVAIFGGLKGELQQNSYYGFAEENPFVSPNLFVIPTDRKYNAFAGIRGKVTKQASYEISGSYGASDGEALFKNNPIIASDQPYTYGNSFEVVYDNITTMIINGQLQFDVNQTMSLGVKGSYFAYETSVEEEAWNKPSIEASLFLDYKFTEKIYAGASLFFVGERKDQFFEQDALGLNTPETVTLGSYFDANIHGGYHINERLGVFLKGQNLAANQYEKWQNAPVQGIQIIGGATYKFDF